MLELEMRCESFSQFALRMSRTHKDYFLQLYPPNPTRLAEFISEAAASLDRQAALEAAPGPTFDEYLAAYFAG